MYFRSLFALVLIVTATTTSEAAEKRPMKIDDLFRFKRVAAPEISPDGKHVAYQVGTVDLEANKTFNSIWIAATDGTTPPRRLTNAIGKSDSGPKWSPDGTKILFQSNRSGSSQLWVIDLHGGEATQLTDISTGASDAIWSPDGTHIAFVSAVYPEFSELPFAESDAKNKEKNDAVEKNPVKARVFTKLFFRHWDSYVEDKRQHLFVCQADGSAIHDATPGDRDAFPTSSTFSSGRDFTFSPDSKFLVFTAVPAKHEAWSTNYDICRVSITNTSTEWEALTKDNLAADSGPQFNPDGKKLAWRRQAKAGYEADKWVIVVADCKPDGTLTGPLLTPTAGMDASVDEFIWSSADHLAVMYASGGTTVLAQLDLQGRTSSKQSAGHYGSLSANPHGKTICFTLSKLTQPNEVFATPIIDKPIDPKKGEDPEKRTADLRNLSHTNDDLLDMLDRTRPESVKVPVEGNVEMQMWILKPPGFDASKKWPVIYLVHGGPQGAWSDGWSYRWNPQLWAAQGYVVAMPNPRGSTGFGQKFVDEIAGDWGGKCYRDLVAGLDAVEKLPYVDKTRIATAGASFGGYMMNWFAVNDIAKRFTCQVNHCSVWNFESMWGTTEELWFDEHEHGGLPWEKPGKYREFSPHTRAGELAKNKVPMLVIQNDLDFRCPIGQGHELFTSLQRNGVPSRMINFPDEGHWVLKPKNSRYWHEEVFAWLKKYNPPASKR